MIDELLEPKRAAAYLQLDSKYLVRQSRLGVGPRYVMPSVRKILFRKQDLDAWRAQWAERGRNTTAVAAHPDD